MLSGVYLLLCIFCLLTSSSIFFSLILFGMAMVVTTKMFFFSGAWYSMMFFFVFMSGLLVLIFYMVSADFKPALIPPSMGGMSMLGVSFCVLAPKTPSFFYNNQYSSNLISLSEGTKILSLSFIIFMVLWLMTKMLFSKNSNFRPLF